MTKKKLILIVISLLLIFSSIGLIIYKSPQVKSLIANFSSQKMHKKSIAELSLDSGKLSIKFNIDQDDLILANNLSSNLGIDNKWQQGLSFELDDSTASKLKPLLPAKLNIKFFANKLLLSTSGLPNLKTALSKKEFNFATGAAYLKVTYASETNYSLQINDPIPLVNFATVSGKLTLSKKTEGLFPILKRIAKIEFEVNGKSVSGVILLK